MVLAYAFEARTASGASESSSGRKATAEALLWKEMKDICKQKIVDAIERKQKQ